jgi:Cu+-exporting ATPase
MKDVDTIVFDKTGTLTVGKPELISIQSLIGADDENLALAYSLEALSEHPLAHAINAAGQAHDLVPQECEAFSAIPGKGVSATINSTCYYLGSLAWLQELGIGSAIPAQDPSLAYAGKIFLADATRLLAVFYVADTIKPEAQSIISGIKTIGIAPYMISGDNQETAAAIAALCGIEKVMARVLPQDKAERIRELQASGRVVAMVGDGINDAIALKQADIGIAMGKGTDIAIEAADITLLRGDLNLIPLALKLSVETFRKIRQNLFWAFFYNLIAIPLAAFGLLHPVIAEIAMAVSSLTVVTNANLLKRRV